MLLIDRIFPRNSTENNTIDRLFTLQIKTIDRKIPKSDMLYRSIANSFVKFIDRSLFPINYIENNMIARLFLLQIEVIDRKFLSS